jgi:hypothetical protein
MTLKSRFLIFAVCAVPFTGMAICGAGSGSAKVDLAWDKCRSVSQGPWLQDCVNRELRKLNPNVRDEEIHMKYLKIMESHFKLKP